jgi:predicted nucleotidyltransferase
MNFNLAHIVPPDKRAHGLNGYKEVIDTVQWGLQQLGHKADYGLNTLSPTAINIVFGLQMLPMESIHKLPPDTIVYNFEQMKNVNAEDIVPQIHAAAQRFRIWEYSEGNVKGWESLGAKNVVVAPVGYAPILRRIAKQPTQDIDVLIYGLPGKDRLDAFHHLCHSGLTTVFVSGLYGTARDELIGRSKIIVNVNLYEQCKIFEIVRVSYLLANRKAVVADIAPDTYLEQDMRSAIRTTTPSQLVTDCLNLAADAGARAALEEAGFAAIERRDIRKILERVLSHP